MHIYLTCLPERNLSGVLIRRFRFGLPQNVPANEILVYEFDTEATLIARFNEILELPEKNDNCSITICCHGDETDGLKMLNEVDRVSWAILRDNINLLKQRFPNLVVVLSACYGATVGPINNDNPFVFGYTFSIPMTTAMSMALLIISEFLEGIHVDQIRRDVMNSLVKLL